MRENVKPFLVGCLATVFVLAFVVAVGYIQYSYETGLYLLISNPGPGWAMLLFVGVMSLISLVAGVVLSYIWTMVMIDVGNIVLEMLYGPT